MALKYSQYYFYPFYMALHCGHSASVAAQWADVFTDTFMISSRIFLVIVTVRTGWLRTNHFINNSNKIVQSLPLIFLLPEFYPDATAVGGMVRLTKYEIICKMATAIRKSRYFLVATFPTLFNVSHRRNSGFHIWKHSFMLIMSVLSIVDTLIKAHINLREV